MINETIKKGRKYRVKDKTGWTRFSFWTKGSDVECDDGRSVEEKVGAINGITDDITSNASDMAASIKAVKEVHDTAQNSIKNLNIQNSNLVYETNSGDSGTIPLSYSLESLGITASSAEINALNGINTNSTVCTEDKVMDIISQKIPANIGGTSIEESKTSNSVCNIYKIGGLTVIWGKNYVEVNTPEYETGEAIIEFDPPFSNSNTYQFISNVDGGIAKALIKKKEDNKIEFTIEKTDPSGIKGNITWIAIGY